MANSSGLIFNPNTYDPQKFDPETRRQLRALIDWFEARGKSNGIAPADMIQVSMDSSAYNSVLPLNNGRVGSACMMHADTPMSGAPRINQGRRKTRP